MHAFVRLVVYCLTLTAIASAEELNGSWATFRARATDTTGGAVEVWFTLDLMAPESITGNGDHLFLGALKNLHFTLTSSSGAVLKRYTMGKDHVGSFTLITTFDSWGNEDPRLHRAQFSVSDLTSFPPSVFSMTLEYRGDPPWNGLPRTTLPSALNSRIEIGTSLYTTNVSVVEVNDERTAILREVSILEGQIASLSNQVATLTSRATTAETQVNSTAAEIRRLQESFSKTLKVPAFVIPGTSLSAQARLIVDSLNTLNSGSKRQLYEYWQTH